MHVPYRLVLAMGMSLGMSVAMIMPTSAQGLYGAQTIPTHSTIQNLPGSRVHSYQMLPHATAVSSAQQAQQAQRGAHGQTSTPMGAMPTGSSPMGLVQVGVAYVSQMEPGAGFGTPIPMPIFRYIQLQPTQPQASSVPPQYRPQAQIPRFQAAPQSSKPLMPSQRHAQTQYQPGPTPSPDQSAQSSPQSVAGTSAG
ncbi:MAG: hypothetical protein AAFV45_09940, partial [Pseudomonadota bacterium]